jgi:hypothetical protein
MGGMADRHGQEAGGSGGTDNRSLGGGGSYSRLREGKMGDASMKETGSCAACLLRLSRWARWQDAERRRPRGGGVHDRGGVGRMHACMHCPDAGVRAELDRIPWPRRPHDSGSAQQGRQSSREAHTARRRLHVAFGAVADGASAHARTHMAAARDTWLSGQACRHAARPGHRGAAATQRRQRQRAQVTGRRGVAAGAASSNQCLRQRDKEK